MKQTIKYAKAFHIRGKHVHWTYDMWGICHNDIKPGAATSAVHVLGTPPFCSGRLR